MVAVSLGRKVRYTRFDICITNDTYDTFNLPLFLVAFTVTGEIKDDEDEEELDEDEYDDEDSRAQEVDVAEAVEEDTEEGVAVKKSFSFSSEGLRQAAVLSGSGDNSCTVSVPIRHRTQDKSFALICLKPGSKPWWLNAELVLAAISFAYKGMHGDGKGLPDWMASLKSYDIRSKPHGDNRLLREKGRYVKNVIGFILTMRTSEVKFLVKRARSILTFVHKIMHDYSVDNGGKYALDFIQDTSKIGDDGQPAGLYRALTKNRSDTVEIEKRMKNHLIAYFPTTFQLTAGVELDKYLTDIDIKEFVIEKLGAKGWGDVSQDTRKACFKYNWKMDKVPVWTSIVREDYY